MLQRKLVLTSTSDEVTGQPNVISPTQARPQSSHSLDASTARRAGLRGEHEPP